MVRAGLLPILAVLVAVEVHAAPVQRLPLSEVRAIEARVADQDAELARRLETFRDQRTTVGRQAAELAARWAQRCQQGHDQDVECERLREAHERLQRTDTLLLSDAWRIEADHLRRMDHELGELAHRAWRRGGEAAGSQGPEPSPAERLLLGGEPVTREVAAHFEQIQALRAEIEDRVSEAAHRLGVDRSERVALILAARASKARALAQALEDGAHALEEAVAMAQLADRTALAQGLREEPIAALPPRRERAPQLAYSTWHDDPWVETSYEVTWTETHAGGAAMQGLFGEVDRLHAEAARLHDQAGRWHDEVRRSMRQRRW